MSVGPYVTMARPSHWFKNIFVLPGIIIAWSLGRPSLSAVAADLVAGFLAVCLAASANYIINEWLDRHSDQFHPVKKSREGAQGKATFGGVCASYALLAAGAVALGLSVSRPFFWTLLVFLLMGWAYNLPPVRTKDRAYLDVLSESVNNPLRFLLGWFILIRTPLPPSSLLVAYWFGGAYLMGIKRYSEYRFINDPNAAKLYRRSFGAYTESSLLISSIFYGLMTAFLGGVFLTKYKLELVFAIPFIAFMFAWYFAIGLKPNSAAQHPEKIYSERGFLLYTLFVALLTLALAFVELPTMGWFLKPTLPAEAPVGR